MLVGKAIMSTILQLRYYEKLLGAKVACAGLCWWAITQIQGRLLECHTLQSQQNGSNEAMTSK